MVYCIYVIKCDDNTYYTANVPPDTSDVIEYVVNSNTDFFKKFEVLEIAEIYETDDPEDELAIKQLFSEGKPKYSSDIIANTCDEYDQQCDLLNTENIDEHLQNLINANLQQMTSESLLSNDKNLLSLIDNNIQKHSYAIDLYIKDVNEKYDNADIIDAFKQKITFHA